MIPKERIQLGVSEAQRLTNYLDGLSPEAWTQPSACDSWQIRDVVAHLTRFMETCKGTISRGIAGDVTTPEGFPPPGSLDPAALGQRISQTTVAYRDALGDQLFEAFKAHNADLDHVLETLALEHLDMMCYHPAGLRPVRAWIDSRATELAMHTWDIRAPHESSPALRSESLPLFMERIVPLASFQARAKLPAPVRYRFLLSGDYSNQYDIVIQGDAAHMEAAGVKEADVTFRCDTEAFVLLMYKRLGLEKAISSGSINSEGNPQLAVGFEQWFTEV